MTWAINEKQYSQRRACGLVGIEPKTYRYQPQRGHDADIRKRMRKIASQRRRFEYRRIGADAGTRRHPAQSQEAVSALRGRTSDSSKAWRSQARVALLCSKKRPGSQGWVTSFVRRVQKASYHFLLMNGPPMHQ